MLTSVFTKAVRDRSMGVIVSTGILVFMAVFALGMYSGLSDDILDLYEEMPPAMAAIYGSNNGTPVGLATGAIYAMIAPAVLLTFAITGGTRAAVGEEKKRSMDLLLANPVSRTGVLMPKAGVVALGTLFIGLATWVAVAGTAAVLDQDMAGVDVFALTVMLIGLGLMFGALAMAVSAWTGRSGLGAGLAGGLAAVAWFVTTVFPVDESLATIAKFTPWYLYTGPDPISNGIGWWSLATMIALAVILTALALPGLNRRDLKG